MVSRSDLDGVTASASKPVAMIRHGSVFLRPAERDDLPRFVAWLGDARTSRTLALRGPISLAMEQGWFERLLEVQGRDTWHFVICRADDARPLGAIGLHDVDTINGSAMLGIFIGDPADTGHGYGSDALRALVSFGFAELRLERIWLDVYAYNERARHVYDRAGFVHEGTLRHALYRDGAFRDVDRMSILREEWAARGPG
jgi:RimJ/RimL family protein N-acetyltransferase